MKLKPILTTELWWNTVSNSVKSRIQNQANLYFPVIYCTGRPGAGFGGKTPVRRQCEGPSWGGKADTVTLDIEKLLKSGYVFRTFDAEAVKLARKKLKNKADITSMVELLNV